MKTKVLVAPFSHMQKADFLMMGLIMKWAPYELPMVILFYFEEFLVGTDNMDNADTFN